MNTKIRGFSLAEMVLVLGVLVALMTMIFPDVASFLNYQKEKNEQLSMLQIKQAMNAYVKKCRALPPADAAADTTVCNVNSADWGAEVKYVWPEMEASGYPLKVDAVVIPLFAKELASVSTLSARDFMFDVYGNARIYRFGSIDKTFRNGDMEIFYATVTTRGRDKGEDSNYAEAKYDWNFDTDGTTPLVEIENYASYAAAGDDEVVKFTDEAHKLELYDERVAQIKRTTEALDSFAYGMRSQDLLDGDSPPSPELIYYPRSTGAGAEALYYAGVISAMAGVGLTGKTINPTDEAQLKMMMRLIGLPEAYAKDPVTGGLIDYTSNPLAGDPCAASAATEAPFPSIRVSASPFDCR